MFATPLQLRSRANLLDSRYDITRSDTKSMKTSNSVERQSDPTKCIKSAPNMLSFEIANFQLDDYPNERIEYVKFLDDNDPRLLFLMTYNKDLDTTYMKVAKIEKSRSLFTRNVSE